MTGCRTAFVATAGAMLVFLIINKNYRICSLIGLLCIIGGVYFIFNPEQFPRIEKLVDNFTVRTKIWHAAIEGIKAHPLFGQGPMTYMMILNSMVVMSLNMLTASILIRFYHLVSLALLLLFLICLIIVKII